MNDFQSLKMPYEISMYTLYLSETISYFQLDILVLPRKKAHLCLCDNVHPNWIKTDVST